jgi:hypothetical protein
MISKKLKLIILLLIPVIYLHGVEEIFTGFYQRDWIMRYFSSFFQTIPQAQYYASHITWWLMIGPSLLLALGGKWRLIILTIFGIFFFVELHHLFDALRNFGYYPGVITSIVFEVLGILYWKELLWSWRNYGKD